MTDILKLPTPKADLAGLWSNVPWASHRITQAGRGSSYQNWIKTRDTVEDLLPEEFCVTASIEHGVKSVDGYERIVNAEHEGVSLVFHEMANAVHLAAYSLDPKKASYLRTLVHGISAKATRIPDPPNDFVSADFWRLTAVGPQSTRRFLLVPEWSEISHNYAESAREQLSKLNDLSNIENPQSGKIVVLHGPAGTGKTTALRALARSWKSWADVHYIIDPDKFLDFADYMWQAVLSITDESDNRWKLLIMEDVDELIRADAKAHVGQAFSRLLNLGGGFLGQGLRLVIVLTTNEPVDRLAPAITRPGRCLAHIEVPKLNASEASKWLGQNHEEATLAELYEVQATSHQMVAESKNITLGQYL